MSRQASVYDNGIPDIEAQSKRLEENLKKNME